MTSELQNIAFFCRNMDARKVSVESVEAFEKLLQESEKNVLLLVHFWAPWAAQCKAMNEVVDEILKDPKSQNMKLVQIEAESLPHLSQKYKIVAVPTFILIKGGVEVERVNGANAPDLNKKINENLGSSIDLPVINFNSEQEDLNQRLKLLINSAKCMLFMKGIPSAPKCGFSKTIIEILKKHNVDFSSFDILSDEKVRQGLKTYSNWPTYPQLYVNGELLGGLDIVKELDETGELAETLPKKLDIKERLKKLVNQAPVMVFMKGSPEGPRCGFSRTLVGILNEIGVKYDTFDILGDEIVRQELKTYSNWPTYPQVYVKGELIGGLDIVKELQETGELKETLNPQ